MTMPLQKNATLNLERLKGGSRGGQLNNDQLLTVFIVAGLS
jgi:hypothetical protein